MKDTYHMIFKNTKMQWNELNLSEKYGDNNNHTIYIFVYHSEFKRTKNRNCKKTQKVGNF